MSLAADVEGGFGFLCRGFGLFVPASVVVVVEGDAGAAFFDVYRLVVVAPAQGSVCTDGVVAVGIVLIAMAAFGGDRMGSCAIAVVLIVLAGDVA